MRRLSITRRDCPPHEPGIKCRAPLAVKDAPARHGDEPFEDSVPCLRCRRRRGFAIFSDCFRCRCQYWNRPQSDCSQAMGRIWLEDGGEVLVKRPGEKISEELRSCKFQTLCGGDPDDRLRCPGCSWSSWILRQDQARCERCGLAVLFPGNPIDRVLPTANLKTRAEVMASERLPEWGWTRHGRYEHLEGRVVRGGIPRENERVELGRLTQHWVPSADTVRRWRKAPLKNAENLDLFGHYYKPRTAGR